MCLRLAIENDTDQDCSKMDRDFEGYVVNQIEQQGVDGGVEGAQTEQAAKKMLDSLYYGPVPK